MQDKQAASDVQDQRAEDGAGAGSELASTAKVDGKKMYIVATAYTPFSDELKVIESRMLGAKLEDLTFGYGFTPVKRTVTIGTGALIRTGRFAQDNNQEVRPHLSVLGGWRDRSTAANPTAAGDGVRSKVDPTIVAINVGGVVALIAVVYLALKTRGGAAASQQKDAVHL